MIPCPECGRPTAAEAAACANCGHALANGAVPQTKSPVEKPPPPPEVSSWVIHRTPPEMIEELRRTFNEERVVAYSARTGYGREEVWRNIEAVLSTF